MASSVTSLTSEIKQRLGNRLGIDGRILTWLNYAYFELLCAPRFSFYELDAVATIPTVANTQSYNLVSAAPDFWFIMNIRDNTNQRIVQRRYIKDVDRVYATTGQPVHYARFQNTIVLDPTPDAVYQLLLRYRKRPALLGASDSLAIQIEWDEILVVSTLLKGLQAFKLLEEAAAQKQYYEQLMAAKVDAVVLEEPDEDFGITVSYDGLRMPGSM